MDYEHKNLAQGRWLEFSLVEQMANIRAEVKRAIKRRHKDRHDCADLAFNRASELWGLSMDDLKNRGGKLKELTRLHEFSVDYFFGENKYGSLDRLWEKYFNAFNYAARLRG